jgi:hypothetical protein
MESLVQTLRARTGLFTTAELMHTANVRFQTGWIGLSTYYKGLSRLLSADSTHHDAPGAADRWLCTLKVIGVAGDSKFGEEGGLKPQPFRKLRFTREIATIAFTTASFQTSLMKRSEVLRSAKKPKIVVKNSSPQ